MVCDGSKPAFRIFSIATFWRLLQNFLVKTQLMPLLLPVDGKYQIATVPLERKKNLNFLENQ